MKLNFAHASPAAAREWHAWSLAIGRRGVITLLGVTAGKASHNASNGRVVTAGKMGCNSSIYNTQEPQLGSKSEITDIRAMLQKQRTVVIFAVRLRINTGKAVSI